MRLTYVRVKEHVRLTFYQFRGTTILNVSTIFAMVWLKYDILRANSTKKGEINS